MRTATHILGFLSAEFLLKRYPNSGTMVMVRSLWTTAALMMIAIAINSLVRYCWPCDFDIHVFAEKLKLHPTWVSIVFAAVYATLYARYSAQWKYLADLYNSMISSRTTVSPEARADADNKQALAVWRAAFISDAVEVHLALKSTFSAAILAFLEYDGVEAEFESCDGVGAADRLRKRIYRIHPGLKEAGQ